MVRPVFEAWLAPFRDLGASTLAIRNNFGSDHGAFDLAGIPAFAFMQDPLDYMTQNHHSNMDLYDYVEAGDLMQASAVLASFVYHAATREQLLPRKPSPSKQ
jgi:carboxypeptidase Q